MINIISTQATKKITDGSQKVFANLVKGLDKIGYPYVINRALNATNRLWIHDDVTALRYMHRSKAYKVLGPNLFVMPKDIPREIDLNGVQYLQPCEWVRRMWEHVGFDACAIRIWPVGIDTDIFRPSDIKPSDKRIMVYHKRRDTRDLQTILDALYKLGLPYRLVLCGQYDEEEYLDLLAETSFQIHLGCSESQGIAMLEAMACDIPILVCDVMRISQAKTGYNFDTSLDRLPVTSAPYFDDTCGVKITDLSEVKNAIELMLDNLNGFSPRNYILRNLSLERQAQAFVSLWEHWGLTFEQGLTEIVRKNRAWSIPLSSKIWGFVRRASEAFIK